MFGKAPKKKAGSGKKLVDAMEGKRSERVKFKGFSYIFYCSLSRARIVVSWS